MNINEFIKQCASENSPIGDLANDILRDSKFPSNKSENEIIRYLEIATLKGGVSDVFEEFLDEYKKY